MPIKACFQLEKLYVSKQSYVEQFVHYFEFKKWYHLFFSKIEEINKYKEFLKNFCILKHTMLDVFNAKKSYEFIERARDIYIAHSLFKASKPLENKQKPGCKNDFYSDIFFVLFYKL